MKTSKRECFNIFLLCLLNGLDLKIQIFNCCYFQICHVHFHMYILPAHVTFRLLHCRTMLQGNGCIYCRQWQTVALHCRLKRKISHKTYFKLVALVFFKAWNITPDLDVPCQLFPKVHVSKNCFKSYCYHKVAGVLTFSLISFCTVSCRGLWE